MAWVVPTEHTSSPPCYDDRRLKRSFASFADSPTAVRCSAVRGTRGRRDDRRATRQRNSAKLKLPMNPGHNRIMSTHNNDETRRVQIRPATSSCRTRIPRTSSCPLERRTTTLPARRGAEAGAARTAPAFPASINRAGTQMRRSSCECYLAAPASVPMEPGSAPDEEVHSRCRLSLPSDPELRPRLELRKRSHVGVSSRTSQSQVGQQLGRG